MFLRWIVELGRIDICAETSMLASITMAPRQGHFEALLHMYAYLCAHSRSRIVLDPSYIQHGDEPSPDWRPFYPDAHEEMPPDLPTPLGKVVELTCFVDSDHAGDLLMRRSRTGILIYVNRAPIQWLSKKQNSVETSTFGSEFTALKTAMDVGSVRLSFIVASSFSESRKRMAGEELSLFTANLNVKVVPERFVHSVRLTNKLIVVSIICVL